jgi:outer membrane protein assembly factor BamB
MRHYRIRYRRLAGVLTGAALIVCAAYAASRGASRFAGSGARGARPGAASRPRAIDGLPPPAYGPTRLPPAWPGPLPYPLLIADSGNARLLEVTPSKRIIWQYPAPGASGASPYGAPGDDAFFTPDGRSIVTNDEDAGTILRIGFYTRRVLWHFGVKGVLGGGPKLLNYPDDAYALPNGNVIVADIRNCREVTISPAGQMIRVWGQPQSGYCQTDPARGLFGYPNGDTPQPNGDILMSFISGDRLALLSPGGRVLWDVGAPDLYGGYVSDAQLLADGNVLLCGYGKPGVVLIFNPRSGRVLWEYHVTSGPGELNHPSLALPLPNGNIVLNDDRNDRVVVIDPRTNRIVWQYGHTGVAGTAPGYLNTPDGIDVDVWRNWLPSVAAPPGGGSPY